MTRFLLVLLIIGLIGLSYLGMWRAWQRRVASQSTLPEPRPLTGTAAVAGPWQGRYIGAAHAGRWLDRVDAHDLGTRSTVAVCVTATGVDLVREGARSFGVPFAELAGVRADTAIAGRAYEDGGLVVLTVRLGATPVDIGIRFPDTDDHLAALAAIAHHSEVAP